MNDNLEFIGENKINMFRNTDIDDIIGTILSQTKPIPHKLQALDELSNRDPDHCTEVISQLLSIYNMSPTIAIETFIADICVSTNIDFFDKYKVAIDIYDHWKEMNEKYDKAHNIKEDEKELNNKNNKENRIEDNEFGNYEDFYEFDEEIDFDQLEKVREWWELSFYIISQDMNGRPYNCQINILIKLGTTKDYKEYAIKGFTHLTNDENFDVEHRYRSIILLRNKVNDDDLVRILTKYIENDSNAIVFRILSSQFILKKIRKDKQIINILLKYASDENLAENPRADAIDVLLHYGNEESATKARKLLDLIGSSAKGVRTFYENSQNIHDEKISEQMQKALKIISVYDILKINDREINFNYVKSKIEDTLNDGKDEKDEKEETNRNKVLLALRRIDIDNAVYGGMMLTTILIKVWSRIFLHYTTEVQNELVNRVKQELCDMSNTCSSGHVSRLINVFAGFDNDISIAVVSWKDQVVANLAGRLRKRIMDIEDIELHGQILIEMDKDIEAGDRDSFDRFFIKAIPKLREELYNEFVTAGFIDDNDFDLYVRHGIMKFQGYTVS
jgi:hypothetical protein